MKPTAIIYGSTTSNTSNVAKKILDSLGGENITLLDIGSLDLSSLSEYSNLILGTSTWGLGDLQDDWDSIISQFSKVDLSGKTVALFGLGDAASYPDTFVDGMGIIFEAVKDRGCTVVGQIPTDGIEFDASRAIVDDKFVGLVIDEDNESNKTKDRISSWVELIKPLLS